MGPAALHASTLLAHAPAALLAQLTRLAATYGGRGHTLLFALSANFPRADDLQAVVHRLNTFHHSQVPTSASAATQLGHGNGHAVGCLTDTPSGDARLSCAVAVFDAAHCVPFRSTLAGRVQPQVGRWHAFRKQSEGDASFNSATGAPDWGDEAGRGAAVDWESVWSRSSQPSAASLLPQALQSIPPSHVSTLLSFSAPHPDALTRALLSYLSQSKSLSSPSVSLTLTAAPTHFITGRPVTLFLDGEIYSDGAVGMALLRDDEMDPKYRTEFVGVKRLGEAMRVTSREGNMINALDDSNPTRLLLSAIDAAGLGSTTSSSPIPLARTFKEDAQFALGVLDVSGQITQTYKITAGDPSARGGSLALDAPRAPGVGSTVQFLHCPSTNATGGDGAEWSLPRGLLPSLNTEGQKKKSVMAFMTVPEPTGNPPSSVDSGAQVNEVDAEVEVLEDAFVAASTQGFVVSQAVASEKVGTGEEESWTCSLAGGVGVLEWD